MPISLPDDWALTTVSWSGVRAKSVAVTLPVLRILPIAGGAAVGLAVGGAVVGVVDAAGGAVVAALHADATRATMAQTT